MGLPGHTATISNRPAVDAVCLLVCVCVCVCVCLCVHIYRLLFRVEVERSALGECRRFVAGLTFQCFAPGTPPEKPAVCSTPASPAGQPSQ